MGRFWAFLEEYWNANEAMIKYFCQTNEAKSHAKSQQPPGASDVGYPTHFLSFSESLGIRFLDQNVYDSKVTFCIVVYFTLDF